MAPRRNWILCWLEYVPLRAVLFVFGWLPEWIAYPFIGTLGRLHFALASKRRRIAREGLRRAFPALSERERRRIAYRSAAAFAHVFVDVARMPRLQRRANIEPFIDLTPLAQAILRARELGMAPPILCTPHLGSWEAAITFGARLLRPLHLIGRRMENPLVDRLLFDRRRGYGQVVHPKKGGIRPLARALASGEAVAFAADQNQRRGKSFVCFFGELASCDRGPIRLAAQYGSPILVGAVVRDGRGFRFRLDMEDVFLVERDDEAALRRMHAGFEALIRRHPEQYLWMHDRWRTRPAAETRTVRATEWVLGDELAVVPERIEERHART